MKIRIKVSRNSGWVDPAVFNNNFSEVVVEIIFNIRRIVVAQLGGSPCHSFVTAGTHSKILAESVLYVVKEALEPTIPVSIAVGLRLPPEFLDWNDCLPTRQRSTFGCFYLMIFFSRSTQRV